MTDVTNDTDGENDRRAQPTIWARHFKSMTDTIVAMTVLGGAVVAVTTAIGWGNPLVMAKDFDQYRGSVEQRLTKIEGALNNLGTGQLEQRELSLQSRVQDLERELTKARPDDPIRLILQNQMNESSQELRRVRTRLEQERPR